MTTDQTETPQAPPRAILDTLLERWQEVADAYSTDAPRDGLDRRYHDYRHIYRRNIRDLQHVLDTGQIPCGLMTEEERRRGDCGQVHTDGDAATPHAIGWGGAAREPWGPDETAYSAAMSVVSLHIAQAFIRSSSEEVHLWARELAHELKRELFDLSGDIGRHLVRMTLQQRALSSDVPF